MQSALHDLRPTWTVRAILRLKNNTRLCTKESSSQHSQLLLLDPDLQLIRKQLAPWGTGTVISTLRILRGLFHGQIILHLFQAFRARLSKNGV